MYLSSNLEDDIYKLKTAELSPLEIGRLQGEIRIIEDLLTLPDQLDKFIIK